MRLIIVGGSDAGIAATLRARELDENTDVTVLVADRYPNFSICGLPFLLSGEVENRRDLAHRSTQELEGRGITLELDTRAVQLDPAGRRVETATGASLQYDAVMVATGAKAYGRRCPVLIFPGCLRCTRWSRPSRSSVTSRRAGHARRSLSA